MDIEKLQQTINREAWQRYRAAQAGTAGTPASREVAAVIAAYEAKHGKASDAKRVDTPATDGPQEAEAKQLCAAIAVAKAKMKAGDVAEANGVHKLAPYVFGG
jgi:hypothetical protein